MIYFNSDVVPSLSLHYSLFINPLLNFVLVHLAFHIRWIYSAHTHTFYSPVIQLLPSRSLHYSLFFNHLLNFVLVHLALHIRRIFSAHTHMHKQIYHVTIAVVTTECYFAEKREWTSHGCLVSSSYQIIIRETEPAIDLKRHAASPQLQWTMRTV